MTGQWLKDPPPAYPSMRIGLLGGSFNPAHEGHRHISLTVLNRLRLHKLWWLVTPGNPLKATAELAPLAERLAQAAATAAHPAIEVTGFEAGLPSPYAIDTLVFLTRRFPSARFVWIMGGDNLASFHKWRRWTEMFRMMPIAVVDRPGYRATAMRSPAATRFATAYVPECNISALSGCSMPAWGYITLPLTSISSTAIRHQEMHAASAENG